LTPTATVEAVWRIEQPRLAARLTRMLRDVGLAEEVVQDAFVLALEHWPRDGIPRNPAAWLTRVATNRALDRLRRTVLIDGKHRQLAVDLAELERAMPDLEAALDEDIDDDLLRLIFTACHPALPPEQRAALALRMLGGLSTPEIARAFLVPETTVAQRIVRAKRTLRDAGIAFETPRGQERRERLGAVLEVIYLIFNEGYVVSAGPDWLRADLGNEAMRLGRLLVALIPQEPEALGLLCLMELSASRFGARADASGSPILLLDQDRSRWDWSLIRRGLDGLGRAMALTPTPGPYQLQAMIAACHARAVSAADTDWIAIAAYYQALACGALAYRRGQPGRCRRHGVRTGAGARHRRRAAGRAAAEGYASVAHGARRPSGQARTDGGSARRIPPRRRADRKRQGARAAARAGWRR